MRTLRNFHSSTLRTTAAAILTWLLLVPGIASAQARDGQNKPVPATGPTQNVEQSIEALFGPEEEEKPAAPVAKSTDPFLYITDTDNGRLVIMRGIQGADFTSMGLPGYGFGRFLRPAQIWVDWEGRVYVADSGNDRVVRLDQKSASGWSEFGGLSAPMGIAVSRQGIFIADTKNNRILRIEDLTKDAEIQDTLSHPQMKRPTSLWIDSEDALYICAGEDPPGGKVFKTWIEKDRRRWRIYEGDGLTGSRFRPSSVVTVGKDLRLLDGSGQRLVDMKNMAGRRSKELRFRSDRKFRLSRPQGLAVDKAGKRFFIADSGNDRILEVDSNGQVLGEFSGLPNDSSTLLRNPGSIFVFTPAPMPEPEKEDDEDGEK